MRSRGLSILMLLFSGLFITPCLAQLQPEVDVRSQSVQALTHYFLDDPDLPETFINQLNGQLEDYLARLENVKERKTGDKAFLRALFFKTHRKYLKKYDPFSTFHETMSRGNYGCLTGTALYAILLTHFNYRFEIIELTDHVYLKVFLEDEVVLIESTLPERGVMAYTGTLREGVDLRSTDSAGPAVTIAGMTDAVKRKDRYQRTIDLTRLCGLQYYNTAIYHLKDEAYELAVVHAQRAAQKYPSQRTRKLMEVIINEILKNNSLSKDTKSGLLLAYTDRLKRKH